MGRDPPGARPVHCSTWGRVVLVVRVDAWCHCHLTTDHPTSDFRLIRAASLASSAWTAACAWATARRWFYSTEGGLCLHAFGDGGRSQRLFEPVNNRVFDLKWSWSGSWSPSLTRFQVHMRQPLVVRNQGPVPVGLWFGLFLNLWLPAVVVTGSPGFLWCFCLWRMKTTTIIVHWQAIRVWPRVRPNTSNSRQALSLFLRKVFY